MLKLSLFWHRRDLRLNDNHGLYQALVESQQVQPMFIFDKNILDQLPRQDLRVQFIHQELLEMKKILRQKKSDLWVFYGDPQEIFKKLVQQHQVDAVFTNEDYEPEAIARDLAVEKMLKIQGVVFKKWKDQVIFEKDEVLTDAGKAYTVYTPYKKKWLSLLKPSSFESFDVAIYDHKFNPNKSEAQFPTLKELGFQEAAGVFPSSELSMKMLKTYDKTRDFPFLQEGTSRLGLHFRFGTISVREMAREAFKKNETWLSELIWREFFMQILWHHPRVVKQSFRPEYDQIAWRSSEADFEKWKMGQTGYPLVDAGMRELKQTGHMHNRVRMVVASFLTKHLLIHWLKGERYFAEKLLDYDLSANNGNWQWAAGSGCDAAPYFRIFNPESQLKKFDPDLVYVKKWVPEYGTSKYPQPLIDHNEARGRALQEYGRILKAKK